LDLPEMELREHGGRSFSLTCHSAIAGFGSGFGHVMLGILRALADDYGALVFLEHRSGVGDTEVLEISVFQTDFAAGRDFDLIAETV